MIAPGIATVVLLAMLSTGIALRARLVLSRMNAKRKIEMTPWGERWDARIVEFERIAARAPFLLASVDPKHLAHQMHLDAIAAVAASQRQLNGSNTRFWNGSNARYYR